MKRRVMGRLFREVITYEDESAIGHVSIETVEIHDEMVERAWRAFDAVACGGADAIREEDWFMPAIRAALTTAFNDKHQPEEAS